MDKETQKSIDECVEKFLPIIKDALNCNNQGLVDYALALVNLRDRELECVLHVDKAGRSYERAAEIMHVDPKTIYNNLKPAHRKLYLSWNGSSFIEYLASEGRKCKL